VAISTAVAAVESARSAWEGVSDKLNRENAFNGDNLARFEPYSATLKGEVWYVTGTRRDSKGDMPEAYICRVDGQARVVAGDHW